MGRLLVTLDAPDGGPSTRLLDISKLKMGVQAHDFWPWRTSTTLTFRMQNCLLCKEQKWMEQVVSQGLGSHEFEFCLWRCWTPKTTLHSFWTNKTTTTNILLSITNPESPFLSRKTMFFQIPGASKLCGKLLFNYMFWGCTKQIGHSESFSSFSKHRG